MFGKYVDNKTKKKKERKKERKTKIRKMKSEIKYVWKICW